MNYDDAIDFIAELSEFLRLQIGIGPQYGTLGHVTGGVLSHQVLHNDPNCESYDENGVRIECQLNEQDKNAVNGVYLALLNIISEGRNSKFCEKLKQLAQYVKSRQPQLKSL